MVSYSLALYSGFWLAIFNECYLTEKKVIITNISCASLFFQPLFFLPSLNRNLTYSDILLYLPLLSSILIQTEVCSKLGFNMVMLRHTLVVLHFLVPFLSLSALLSWTEKERPCLGRKMLLWLYSRIHNLQTLLGRTWYYVVFMLLFYKSLVPFNKIVHWNKKEKDL